MVPESILDLYVDSIPNFVMLGYVLYACLKVSVWKFPRDTCPHTLALKKNFQKSNLNVYLLLIYLLSVQRY
jgi:hypothetical protein